MLDKSIPYKHILMKRPKGTPVKNYALPDGYSLCLYQEGNERDWAEIESSVLEFDDPASALKYYDKEFMPYPEELKRRQYFVRDPEGKMAATASAWWKMSGDRRVPILHWVAVKPEYQGKGLGKALVTAAVQRMIALEGDVDIYLHTQTWSYKAINIYLDAGFELLQHETYGGYKNEYEDAIKLIGDRIRIR